MTVDFELLAESTAFHIVLDEDTHKFAWMASSRSVMISCHDFSSNFNILWYIAFVAIEKDGFVVDMIYCPIRKIGLCFNRSVSL